MFAITEAMRSLWDWNPAWGPQPYDQHVRDRLKADDGAVLGLVIDAELYRQWEAEGFPDHR